MNKLSLLSRIALVLSPFFLPWWLVLILALAALFFYDNFYEIICIGLVCDVLYATSTTFLGLYGLTILACLFLMAVKQLKKRLIMY